MQSKIKNIEQNVLQANGRTEQGDKEDSQVKFRAPKTPCIFSLNGTG